MTFSFPVRVGRWVLPALLLLPGARECAAQQYSDLEPRWLRLNLPQASVGMDFEGLQETVKANGVTSTHDNLLLVPLVGLRLQGSAYHPNLMTFDLSGQGGVGWAHDSITSPGFSQVRNETQNLFTYLATVNFLSSKPYNGTFFASQDHTYNNYDFFNTVTADSTRYGGHVGWSTTSFNLNTDAGYRNLLSSGMNGTSEVSETYLNFNGQNQREHGSAILTYNYDNLANQLNYGPVQSSVSQSVGVSDSETFGSRNQITASTGASYGWADYADRHARTLNLNENITVRHRPNLESFMTLNYQHNQLEPATSDMFQGLAGIRHQLYDSLTSTLDLHGNKGSFAAENTSAQNDRYGVGLAEGYSKGLCSWAHLNLGGTAILDHQDHNSSGTGLLTIINESHVLKDISVVFLNNPRVFPATIIVTGPGGIPTYVNGTDYRIISHGEMTEIQRIPTSIDLLDGSTILVSYSSDSSYTSSFDSINGSVSVRIDLFSLVGVYGRYNAVDNNAPPEALAQTLSDWVGGVDVTWRWLRAGAEYEDYDSNFSQYRGTRIFQSLSFQLSDSSNLSFNFNQVFYKYPYGPDQTQYQCIGVFNTQISSWLNGNLETGYYRQDAMGTSQDLAAACAGLIFTHGKLTLKLGYQYNYQMIQMGQQERNRNFGYVQLKRDL